MESLIKGGACDCLGCPRAAMAAALDAAVLLAQKQQKEKESRQTSLFSLIKEKPLPPQSGLGFPCPEENIPEWNDGDMLFFEKEALGFFLTSHPLQPFRRKMAELNLVPLEECRDLCRDMTVRCGVLVTRVKETLTRKGDRMAFCQVEDLSASGECIFFPEAYAEAREFLHSDQPLLLECRIDDQPAEAPLNSEDEDEDEDTRRLVRLVGQQVTPLAEPVLLEVDPPQVTGERLRKLRELLTKHKGIVPVHIHVRDTALHCRLALPRTFSVRPGPSLERDLALWSAGS
jgi:DNA polymerase-3 subunit alpha